MTNDPATRLLRKVRLARLGLAFERLGAAAFPAVMTFGLALLFVVSGASQLVPVALRLGILAIAAILFVGFAFRLLGVPLPSAAEGLARLERDNRLKHRPATSWLDTLALGADNPDSRVLWIAHKNRLKRELEALQSHLPRSPLPARDPMALRNGLALGPGGGAVPQCRRLARPGGRGGEPGAPAGGAGPRRCLDLAAGLYRAGPGAAHRRGPGQPQRRRCRVPGAGRLMLTVRINGARDGQVTLYQLLADGERGAVARDPAHDHPQDR